MLSTDLARHLKSCKVQEDCCYDCPLCNYMGCRQLGNMKAHYQRKHPDANFKCKRCGWQFTEEGFFDTDHVNSCMKVTRDQTKAAAMALQPIRDAAIPDYKEDPPTIPDADSPVWGEHAEEANEKIREQWWRIRQHFKIGVAVHEYTFRAVGSDITNLDFKDMLRFIYSKETQAFTFNVHSIYLLVKIEDEDNNPIVPEYMVFVPQNAQYTVFEKNLLVHDLASLKEALEELGPGIPGQLIEICERPNTKWIFAGHLCYVFCVYVRSSFMLGRPLNNLPSFFTKKKGIIPNEYDKNGNLFNDNLCFFRCLTKFLGGDMYDKEEVITNYEKFARFVNGSWWDQFEGMQEEHFPIIEDLFDINVEVIACYSDRSTKPLRSPLNLNRKTMVIELAAFEY